MLVSADALSPILALQRNVSLSYMCLFTPCVCCVVVVVLLLTCFLRCAAAFQWGFFLSTEPLAALPRLNFFCHDLGRIVRVKDLFHRVRTCRDQEKSNNLPPALLIPGMLVTRRCQPPCSALAGAGQGRQMCLNTVGPDILGEHEQVHHGPSNWAVQ